MGIIIPARNFSRDNVSGLLKPIIYCCPYEDIADTAVPVNLPLAEKLAGCVPERRTLQIENFFGQVLSRLPDDAVIRDIDVMFNPAYKVDVLRILTAAYKKKPFSVVWPGKYGDGKLFYAENGDPDLKIYSIAEYDVTCIV